MRRRATPRRGAATALVAALWAASGLGLSGCGESDLATRAARDSASDAGIPPALIAQRRPIGSGPRFQPPARGPVTGVCRHPLGARDGVHVELFAADRVVLVAAGIGARAPLTHSAGRISDAACFGQLVTLEPTGVVLIRPGAQMTLHDLFRAWGQPLSEHRLASFTAAAGGHVSVYVGGRLWTGSPGAVPLTRHAEIVLEVGPHVPPHTGYTFPPGT